MISKCKLCGKKFTPRKGGIFCSRSCSSKYNSGPLAPKWAGGGVKLKCISCGKEFVVNKDRAEKRGAKCCSWNCYKKWHIGDKTSNWNGGVTPIYEIVRHLNIYKNWMQQVFIRDNFTCQKCGDKLGGNLNAHHIKHFKELIEEAFKYLPLFDKITAATSYTPLWDIDNGITYCKKCHQEEHKK